MTWNIQALLLGLILGLARCQDYTDECPEKNGFFADAVQCDRYYECKDGQVESFYNCILDRYNLFTTVFFIFKFFLVSN